VGIRSPSDNVLGLPSGLNNGRPFLGGVSGLTEPGFYDNILSYISNYDDGKPNNARAAYAILIKRHGQISWNLI
jgi:hypothetical protein